jgi:hypothetical protein
VKKNRLVVAYDPGKERPMLLERMLDASCSFGITRKHNVSRSLLGLPSF